MAQDFGHKWNQLIAKAWADPALKQRLLANPAEVLKEEGMVTPPGVQIKVVENTETVIHLTLPPPPTPEELSEEELQQVAGGFCAFDCCCGGFPCASRPRPGCNRCACGGCRPDGGHRCGSERCQGAWD